MGESAERELEMFGWHRFQYTLRYNYAHPGLDDCAANSARPSPSRAFLPLATLRPVSEDVLPQLACASLGQLV